MTSSCLMGNVCSQQLSMGTISLQDHGDRHQQLPATGLCQSDLLKTTISTVQCTPYDDWKPKKLDLLSHSSLGGVYI